MRDRVCLQLYELYRPDFEGDALLGDTRPTDTEASL